MGGSPGGAEGLEDEGDKGGGGRCPGLGVDLRVGGQGDELADDVGGGVLGEPEGLSELSGDGGDEAEGDGVGQDAIDGAGGDAGQAGDLGDGAALEGELEDAAALGGPEPGHSGKECT